MISLFLSILQSIILAGVGLFIGAWFDVDIRNNGNYRNDLGSTIGLTVGLWLAAANIFCSIYI
jgi:hypothetical protein